MRYTTLYICNLKFHPIKNRRIDSKLIGIPTTGRHNNNADLATFHASG